MSVNIPVGVDNGDQIRLAGEGEAGKHESPAGDLYVSIRVKEHEIFQRNGDNLHCNIPITFTSAALGDEVIVPAHTVIMCGSAALFQNAVPVYADSDQDTYSTIQRSEYGNTINGSSLTGASVEEWQRGI